MAPIRKNIMTSNLRRVRYTGSNLAFNHQLKVTRSVRRKDLLEHKADGIAREQARLLG
jgi:hypothetical protein